MKFDKLGKIGNLISFIGFILLIISIILMQEFHAPELLISTYFYWSSNIMGIVGYILSVISLCGLGDKMTCKLGVFWGLITVYGAFFYIKYF